MRYISGGDNQQETGRSKRSRSKRKSAQESTLSPGKKQRLSSRGLDVHCQPGDHETTQGAMRSPEKNRRLAEPSDREPIQGTIDSPRKRRLSSLRYVGGGDNQQEAGRSKRSRSKRKSTQESELSPGKKQRLSSTRSDIHDGSGEGDPFCKTLKNLIQINRTDTTVNRETTARARGYIGVKIPFSPKCGKWVIYAEAVTYIFF